MYNNVSAHGRTLISMTDFMWNKGVQFYQATVLFLFRGSQTPCWMTSLRVFPFRGAWCTAIPGSSIKLRTTGYWSLHKHSEGGEELNRDQNVYHPKLERKSMLESHSHHSSGAPAERHTKQWDRNGQKWSLWCKPKLFSARVPRSVYGERFNDSDAGKTSVDLQRMKLDPSLTPSAWKLSWRGKMIKL